MSSGWRDYHYTKLLIYVQRIIYCTFAQSQVLRRQTWNSDYWYSQASIRRPDHQFGGVARSPRAPRGRLKGDCWPSPTTTPMAQKRCFDVSFKLKAIECACRSLGLPYGRTNWSEFRPRRALRRAWARNTCVNKRRPRLNVTATSKAI